MSESRPVDQREDYGPFEDHPQVRFTYSATLMPGSTMAFETVVDQHAERAALAELSDRLVHVIERQKAKIEIEDHEKQILILERQQKEQAERRIKLVGEYQAQHRGTARAQAGRSFEPNAKQRGDLDQVDQALEQIKSQLAIYQAMIAKKRAMIDGVPDSPLPLAAE
jgi:hypothetical protein